ncbi:MAG: VOC family protein [Anaerolineae bacterium]|nr:VOC family protein [Anaerolineae bacterium]
MRCIAVDLDVPEIDAAVAYYRDRLGFAEGLHIPDIDGGTRYATVWAGEATIMFNRIDSVPPDRRPYLGTGVTLYVDMGDGDIDAYYRTLMSQGVQVIKPLADEYWGARDFTIADLNGYHITFARQLRELTPEQMVANLRQRERV